MLLALLLLVPALRLALIFAYRPLFIWLIVPHPTPPHHQALAGEAVECHFFSGPAGLKIHYGTPQVKGEGGRTKESPFPLVPPWVLVLYIYRNDTSVEEPILTPRIDTSKNRLIRAI